MNLTQKRLLEISNNAISELEFSEYEHEAILKYLQSAINETGHCKKSKIL